MALVVNIVGVVKDESKKYAIAGLVISAISCLFWLVPLLLCI